MNKSDLKTGMRVRMRNGQIYLVVRDVLIRGEKDILFANEYDGWMNGNSYDENLVCNGGGSNSRSYDIVEVYTIDEKQDAFQYTFMNLKVRHLIWKRQEYTEKQKEIFKALKTLGYNYIARDSDYTPYAYESKPEKYKYDWQSKGDVCIELETSKILNAPHLDFIDWEDEEPFEIPSL